MFVKVCGITRLTDALHAAEQGATALGFVFWPHSPRYVTPARAAEIIAELPPSVMTVGVFVNATVEDIEAVAAMVGITAVQLHGDEPPSFAEALSLPVLRAVDVEEAASVSADWPEDTLLLLDAIDPAKRGGTGVAIDWNRAAESARLRRIVLAGGLTPDNVSEAIRRVGPFGVDVSSGVEAAPGIKDGDKVTRFVTNARKAFGAVMNPMNTSSPIDRIRSASPTSAADSTRAPRPPEPARPRFGQRDPDARGYFGSYGGRFVPETLVAPIEELTAGYLTAREDPAFREELDRLLAHYVGRPTPLFETRRLVEAARGAGEASEAGAAGGVRILLKREDLTHTGAHKINNALGQALLAVRMGKRRIVAETGAGQHGVATATACALLGLECRVYMGTEDMRRQALNVVRMQLLGATVHGVDAGSCTLKDAINEAMRDWVANVTDTYYLLGSALGPHPYPLMVREFQSVIGREARQQMLDQVGRLPDVVVACVGGGSNAIGIFDGFLDDPGVRLIGVEAGGEKIAPGRHAARFDGGSVGVLQGTRTFVMQDEAGNIELTHSISAGLDYAAVGPEHAWLRDLGRTEYVHASDTEALEGFKALARLEGIIPALESAHAVWHAMTLARDASDGTVILVNLSGRGDKDVQSVAAALEATS